MKRDKSAEPAPEAGGFSFAVDKRLSGASIGAGASDTREEDLQEVLDYARQRALMSPERGLFSRGGLGSLTRDDAGAGPLGRPFFTPDRRGLAQGGIPQESPFSAYVKQLSPITPGKTVHMHTFPELYPVSPFPPSFGDTASPHYAALARRGAAASGAAVTAAAATYFPAPRGGGTAGWTPPRLGALVDVAGAAAAAEYDASGFPPAPGGMGCSPLQRAATAAAAFASAQPGRRRGVTPVDGPSPADGDGDVEIAPEDVDHDVMCEGMGVVAGGRRRRLGTTSGRRRPKPPQRAPSFDDWGGDGDGELVDDGVQGGGGGGDDGLRGLLSTRPGKGSLGGGGSAVKRNKQRAVSFLSPPPREAPGDDDAGDDGGGGGGRAGGDGETPLPRDKRPRTPGTRTPGASTPGSDGTSGAPGGNGGSCKGCHCKKSKCLKLYCECFAAGLYCSSCTCLSCQNTAHNAVEVARVRGLIESRNPLAFAPKITTGAGDSPAAAAAGGGLLHGGPGVGAPTFAGFGPGGDAKHKFGCRCKKSRCLKKYCECYQAGVGCSPDCKCENCQNQGGGGPSAGPTTSSRKRESRVVDDDDDDDDPPRPPRRAALAGGHSRSGRSTGAATAPLTPGAAAAAAAAVAVVATVISPGPATTRKRPAAPMASLEDTLPAAAPPSLFGGGGGGGARGRLAKGSVAMGSPPPAVAPSPSPLGPSVSSPVGAVMVSAASVIITGASLGAGLGAVSAWKKLKAGGRHAGGSIALQRAGAGAAGGSPPAAVATPAAVTPGAVGGVGVVVT